MGLLDDAIREHLELKRLRGADPGEVAREEKDVLGSAPHEVMEQRKNQAEALSDTDGSFFLESESGPTTDPLLANHSSQETVEINMDVEFAAGTDVEHERELTDDGRAAPAGPPAHTRTDPDESLERRMPDDRSCEHKDVAAPEDAVESDMDENQEAAKHMEDVLEEIPDFLRDTPEQERLWFEQRPPRDFDFNE